MVLEFAFLKSSLAISSGLQLKFTKHCLKYLNHFPSLAIKIKIRSRRLN